MYGMNITSTLMVNRGQKKKKKKSEKKEVIMYILWLDTTIQKNVGMVGFKNTQVGKKKPDVR